MQIRQNTSVTTILFFLSVCDSLHYIYIYIYNGYVSYRILSISHIHNLQIHSKKSHNTEKCESKLNCSAPNPQLTIQADVLIIQLPLLIAILIELRETYYIKL